MIFNKLNIEHRTRSGFYFFFSVLNCCIGRCGQIAVFRSSNFQSKSHNITKHVSLLTNFAIEFIFYFFLLLIQQYIYIARIAMHLCHRIQQTERNEST